MMRLVRLIQLLTMLVLFVLPVAAQDNQDTNADVQTQEIKPEIDWRPDRVLPNEVEARQAGATFVNLKNGEHANCVMTRVRQEVLTLTIYDEDLRHRFVRAQELSIPIRYDYAEVTYENLLGDERKFIFLRFIGDSGTGTKQDLLAIIGWHKDSFKLVFLETTAYELFENRNIEMKHHFIDRGSDHVAIELNYEYSRHQEDPPEDVQQSWTEQLHWNNERFTFYDRAAELKRKRAAKYELQRNIAKVRMATIGFDIVTSGKQIFDRTSIIEVMSAE